METMQVRDSEKDKERSLDELESEIGELSAHIDAATCRLLLSIAEYDRREGWAARGFRSGAHWLSWRVGLDLGAARERLRVGHALEKLPLIRTAFAAGEVSYSKVRAMTRVATSVIEEQLLEVARHGTAAHVEKLVRLFREGSSADDLARAQQQRDRYLETWTDEEGMLVLRARLPVEVGALVKRALEAAMTMLQDSAEGEGQKDQRVEGAATEEPHETPETPETEELAEEQDEQDERQAEKERLESIAGVTVPWGRTRRVAPLPAPDELVAAQRRADALGLVAEWALAAAASGQQGPAAGGREGRFEVVLHVDKGVLSTDAAAGRCELEGGTRASAETARRLCCSSPIVTVAQGNRRTRRVSAPLWRALCDRDETCQFPGCTCRRGLVVHHVEHWAHGGETTQENLIRVCRAHHWALHEGGFRVEGHAPDELAFFTPDGGELPSSPPVSTLVGATLIEQNREQGLIIGPETGLTRWAGERMDYDWAVASLLHRLRVPPRAA